jgi:hypothetical protein
MAGLIESRLHRDLEVVLGEQQQGTVSMRAGELNREIEERLRLLGNVTSLMALGHERQGRRHSANTGEPPGTAGIF